MLKRISAAARGRNPAQADLKHACGFSASSAVNQVPGAHFALAVFDFKLRANSAIADQVADNSERAVFQKKLLEYLVDSASESTATTVGEIATTKKRCNDFVVQQVFAQFVSNAIIYPNALSG